MMNPGRPRQGSRPAPGEPVQSGGPAQIVVGHAVLAVDSCHGSDSTTGGLPRGILGWLAEQGGGERSMGGCPPADARLTFRFPAFRTRLSLSQQMVRPD